MSERYSLYSTNSRLNVKKDVYRMGDRDRQSRETGILTRPIWPKR